MLGLAAVCLFPNFPIQEILRGLDEGWLVELVVPVLLPPCGIGLLEATLPEYFLRSASGHPSLFCGDSHVEPGDWEQEGWLECRLLPRYMTVVVSVELESRLPKYHISTAWAKRSGANAWASAHALSMVTWYHQKIVNGYCLCEPLLLWVFIMNLQIVVGQCLVVTLNGH